MSSPEHIKSDQDGPLNYKDEYQKLKEENALLKQALEHERKLNIELKAREAIWSEVTILVDGKEMVAPRAILSRSPVLAALLKQSNRLEITDTKLATFEILMYYLCTGQVPLLEPLAATDLMTAAKVYQLDGLKKHLIGQRVTHLPRLCLAALFRQMTLQDQIGARKVCRRWDVLVLDVTRKRRSLPLLLGDNTIEDFEHEIDRAQFEGRQALKELLNATGIQPIQRLTPWNSLRFDLLDQSTAQLIASTFPGINKLQVAVLDTTQSTADTLVQLLEQWSQQLITLQLFEVSSSWEWDGPPPTGRLFAAINALSSLKHLHLDLFRLPLSELSIISRLEEVRLFSDGTTPGEFAQWLVKYGENNRNLARIDYVHTEYSPDFFGPFIALREPLRRCITRLDSGSIYDPATLCTHFRNLTSLCLDRTFPVHHLFTQLATLHQLMHLGLRVGSYDVSTDDQEHHLLLPQVKSVKALDLKLWGSLAAHQMLAKLKLGWTLPNVEFINFQYPDFECTECDCDKGDFSQARSAFAKHCLRQFFAPLKHDCSKLRQIKYDLESIHGPAEALL